MKKIIALAVFAFLLVVLVSCEKDPKPGPPPVTCTITTTVIGKGVITPDKMSGVVLGSNVTFKLTPDIGYSVYSIKVSEVKDENFNPSPTEVNYNLMDVKKPYLTVEVTFVETDILLVSVKSVTNDKPWMLTKVGVYKAEGDVFLRNWNLTQAEKTDRYFFVYPSMDAFVYQVDGGIRTGKWSLRQKSLQLASEVLEVIELTSNKLVYKAKPIWSGADNCYVYAIYTFERN